MHKASPCLQGQRDVLANREISDNAVPFPVLGAESQFRHDGIDRFFDGNLFAAHGFSSLRGRHCAEEQLGSFRSSASQQTCEAHQLAFADREIDVLDLTGRSEILRAKHLRCIGCDVRTLEVEDGVHVFADHIGDQLQLRYVVDVKGSDQPAVSQDGQTVAYSEDLVQKMCDEDDSHAFRFQFVHNVKQKLDLVVVERRGRLVQDQNLCVDVYGAGNGDHLLYGCRIVAQRTCDIDVHMEPLHQLRGPAVDFLPVDHAALHRLTSDKNVLRDGQIRAEVNLLVDCRYPHRKSILRIGRDNLLPIQQNRARIHVVDTRQAFDQRALPGAVFPQKCVNLARSQRKVDPVQCFHTGEQDLNAFHFK